MSIDRVYHCDGPDCEVHCRTATPPPYVPMGFFALRQATPGGPDGEWHFCTPECVMKFAAGWEPTEYIAGGPE